jgi:hypothetical protein
VWYKLGACYSSVICSTGTGTAWFCRSYPIHYPNKNLTNRNWCKLLINLWRKFPQLSGVNITRNAESQRGFIPIMLENVRLKGTRRSLQTKLYFEMNCRIFQCLFFFKQIVLLKDDNFVTHVSKDFTSIQILSNKYKFCRVCNRQRYLHA